MRGKTLSEYTAERIVELIREEGYEKGDKLPTETELMARLNVGRNTLREALQKLSSQNILYIKQGSGTYISDKNGIPDDPFGFSLVKDKERLTLELMELRLLMEPGIAALAAERRTEEDIRRLGELLDEMEQQMEKRVLYAEQDSSFHSYIAACTHNNMISNLLPVITRGVLIFGQNVSTIEYEKTVSAHREIYEAIRAGKPVEAERAMTFHLLYNKDRYGKVLQLSK